jgi:hypothetical protein
MIAAAPPLAPDIAAGLRRLKLSTIRQLAPELLITAKTWTACSITRVSWSPTATHTACARPEHEEEPPDQEMISPTGGGFNLATSGDHNLAVDIWQRRVWGCKLRSRAALMASLGLPARVLADGESVQGLLTIVVGMARAAC